MSSRPGYIGGYVDTELKAKFVQAAEENGMNQTDYLNSILDNHFGTATNYSTLDPEELESFINDDREEWDKLGSILRRQLNCMILQADKEVAADSNLHLPQVLENLGDMLHKESDNPPNYNCEEEEAFEEVLDEDLANEITTVIARAIREFGGATPSKEQLFSLAGNFLSQRADTLYVDGRRLTMKFSREQWYYLDKLLNEVNESGETSFASLPNYIRYKLGEQLEYAARGFLAPRDRGMLEMGQLFMKETQA